MRTRNGLWHLGDWTRRSVHRSVRILLGLFPLLTEPVELRKQEINELQLLLVLLERLNLSLDGPFHL